ncbi:uncharacterized protein LOC124115781 [Haliotis rufescens]|uniref:uncharacterized protein LOC124115781 n=1 Tax=Haliotis rufescens TaxID=6454 RepID=UPI001EAF9090|nr:uncharacterized protein LOC124115781 [Haliotis rufescens]
MIAALVLAVVVAVAQGCPDRYSSVGTMCVHPHRIQSTYAEAYSLCRLMRSQVAAPTTDADKLALSTFLQTLNLNDSFYVKGSAGLGLCSIFVKGEGYEQQSTKCENANYFVCQKS